MNVKEDVQSKDREDTVGGPFPVEEYAQLDKEILARLLKLGVEDILSLAQGKPLDLSTNEELPRLIPVICAYFSREALVNLLGEDIAGQVLTMYRTEMLQNLYLEGELVRILHAFNEARIPLLLFKGPALAYTVYPQANLRTYHDIDAFVHPHDLSRAGELLTELGFSFYEEYRANALDETRTGYNYILKHPNSWLEVLVELHTAPHSSDIGTHFDIASLWAKAQPITILGEAAYTMHSVDHLLYLVWHYRFHGFTRLLWLYDLVMMVRSLSEELDWAALIQAARKQQLATTLYYCLSWCRKLFAVAVPQEVLVQLRPPMLCRFIVERVAMPDVERALTGASWQKRRVLAHHAMVDRTVDIVKAILRTLFPAPAVLGRRYLEHSRLPLQLSFLLYGVHPWITLGKGVRYLLARK